jgi:hypothetical protein
MQKYLQIGTSERLVGRFAFQELCRDTWGLDNEQTMSDADGSPGDEAARWSSQSPPGFERQPASWPLLLSAVVDRQGSLAGVYTISRWSPELGESTDWKCQ